MWFGWWILWLGLCAHGARAVDCSCVYQFGEVVATQVTCTGTGSGCSCIDATNPVLPLVTSPCPGTVVVTSSLTYDAFAVTSLCNRLVPARVPRIPPFLVDCVGAECGGQINGTRTVITAIDRTNASCSFTRRIDNCSDPTPCVANQACVVSPWSLWSGCSRTCSDGIQIRTRSILSAENRTTCPTLRETLNCSWLSPCPDTATSRVCTSIEQAASPCGNATGCIVNCTSLFTDCRPLYPACNSTLYNASVLAAQASDFLYRQCGVHATTVGPPCVCASQTSVVAHAGLPCNGIRGLCREDEIQYINQTCRVSVPWSQRLPTDIYDQSRELTRTALPTDVVCNNLQRQELCGLGNVSQCRWPYLEKCVCAPGTLTDGYRCLATNESYTRNCTDVESRTCTRCNRYSAPGICADGLQCVVDCSGNTTGCVRRNTTCTEITLQVLECDTRDRIRYCGDSAIGCTWEVLYDPSRGIIQRFPETLDCYCGPMAVSLPVVPPYWNYGRPCATALTYQVPCTVAQMLSQCNTSLTLESTRLNEDPRFCLQRPLALALTADQRVVPGTCPTQYQLRNCTEEEVYRHCPLDDQVACKMACPLTTDTIGSGSAVAECRRWGECTIRRACTLPEAARYCGKFGTECVIDIEDRAGVAAQVVLNASSCVYECEDPWYGLQCRSNYNEGPCTVERGIAACGGPWQWHTCTSLSVDRAECGCRTGYGNPVPTVLGRNESVAYLDTQLYGYCAGTERNCSNATERAWYAGDHALSCTLWCATAQPEDCRLGAYTCSPFSYPVIRKGFFRKSEGLVMDLSIPCGTRTVYVAEYDAEPTIVQNNCGRGARSMAASLTYTATGTVSLIEFVPGSCVCQDNFFASDQFACDATFYQRPCTDTESAVVPRDLKIGCPSYACRLLCYPPRGTRGELCFAHAPDACLDHVSLWASLPGPIATQQCGDYVAAGIARCVFRSDLSFSRVCAVTNVSCHCLTTQTSSYTTLPRLVYQNVTALQTLGGGIRPCDELYDVQPCVSRAEAFVLCGVSPFALSCTKRIFASGKPAEAHVCQCETGFTAPSSARVCATRIQGEVCDSIGNAPCGGYTLRIDHACINQTGRVDCTPLCTCLPGGITYDGIPCGGLRRECTEAERRSQCGGRFSGGRNDLNCQMDCAVVTPSSPSIKRACTVVPGACTAPRATPSARRTSEAPAAAVRLQCGPAAVNCTWDVVYQKCITGTCVCVSGTTAVLFNQLCEWRHHVFRPCPAGVTASCGPSHVYNCRERRVFLTAVMNTMMGFPTQARTVMTALAVDPVTKESRFLEPNPTVTCQTRITTTALQDQAIQNMRFLSIDDDVTNPTKPFLAYAAGAGHVGTFAMTGVPLTATGTKCMPDGWVAADGQPLWRPLASSTIVQVATGVIWLRECLCQSDVYAMRPGPPYWWSVATALNTSTSQLATDWRNGIRLNPIAIQDRLWCSYETLEPRRRNGACPTTPTNNLACNGLGVCSYWRQSIPVICRQYRETYASCVANAFRTPVDGNAPVKAFLDMEGFAAISGQNRSIYDVLYQRAGPIPTNMAALMAAINIPPPGAPAAYASYVDFSQTLVRYLQSLAAAQAALDAAQASVPVNERRLQDYGPCTDYINQVATGRVLPGTGLPIGCRAILETNLLTNAPVIEVHLRTHVFRAPLRDNRAQVNSYLDFITRNLVGHFSGGKGLSPLQVAQVLFNTQCGLLSQYFETGEHYLTFGFDRRTVKLDPVQGLIPVGGITYKGYTAMLYTDVPFGRFPRPGRWSFIGFSNTGDQAPSSDMWASPLYVHPWLYTGNAKLVTFVDSTSLYSNFLDESNTAFPVRDFQALLCSQSLGLGETSPGTLRGSPSCTEFRTCYYTALTDLVQSAYNSYRLGAQRTTNDRYLYGSSKIDLIISRILQQYSTNVGFYKFGLLTSYQTIQGYFPSTSVKNLFYRALTIRDYYMPLFWYWNTRCAFSSNNPLVQGLPSFTGTPSILWPFFLYPWRAGRGLTVQVLNVWVGMLSENIRVPICPFCDSKGIEEIFFNDELAGKSIGLHPALYIQRLIASQPELMSCLSPFTQDFVVPEVTDVLLGNGCSNWGSLATFCDTQQAFTGSCEDVLPSIQQMSARMLDVSRNTLDQRVPEVLMAVGLLNQYTQSILTSRDSCQSLTCRMCPAGWTGDFCHIRDCADTLCAAYVGFVGLCPTSGLAGYDKYVPGIVPTGTCCDGQPCYLPLDWTGRPGCVNGYFDWAQGKCICDLGWTIDDSAFKTCIKSKCNEGNYPLNSYNPPAPGSNRWVISRPACSNRGLCVMSDANTLAGVCECNANSLGVDCVTDFATACLIAACNDTGHGICARNANNTAVQCLCASSNYDTGMGLPSVGCPVSALPGFTLDTASSGLVNAVSQCRYVRVFDYTYTAPLRAPAVPSCTQVYCDYFGRCGCSVPDYTLTQAATSPSASTNATANPKVTVNFTALCPPSICPYPYRRDDLTLSVQCACILDRYDWPDDSLIYEWRGSHCLTPWAPCQNGGTAVAEPSSLDPHRVVCRCPSGFSGLYCERSQCPRTAGNVTCNGYGTCSGASPRDCRLPVSTEQGRLKCVRAPGTTIDFNTGGCLCDKDLRTFCRAPGSENLCSGDQRPDGRETCVPQVNLVTQRVEYLCNCSDTRQGQYCEEARCTIPPELRGYLAFPCNGRTCLYNSNTQVAQCQCNKGTVLPLSQPVLAGSHCEYDVTAACGYNPPGTPFQSICNNRGTCIYNTTRSNFQCRCDAGYTGAVCQLSICQAPCAFGTCVPDPLSPSGSICRCTHPNVIGLNLTTGSCTANQCGMASPSDDGSQCVCPDPTRQAPLCLQAKCLRVDGQLCGPFAAGDIYDTNSVAYADGTRSSRYKYCTPDGACVCNPFLYNTSVDGSCIPICNQTHTVGAVLRLPRPRDPLTGFPRDVLEQCVCEPGYTPESRCTEGLCVLNQGVFDAGASRCVCRAAYNGTRCADTKCGARGVPNADGSLCICTPPWTGDFCEILDEGQVTLECANGGTLVNGSACQCVPPFTGPTCNQHLCFEGVPDAVGSQLCICNSTEWIGDRCDIRVCRNGGVFDLTTLSCTCPLQYTGPLCETRRCSVGGNYIRLGTFEACLCRGLWQLDVYGNCTASPCVNGLPKAPSYTSCACTAPYVELTTTAAAAHRCQLPCSTRGNYSTATRSCICVDGYHGLLCESEIIGSVISAVNGTTVVTVPLSPTNNVTVTETVPGAGNTPDVFQTNNNSMPLPGGEEPSVPTTPQVPPGTLDNGTLPNLPEPEATALSELGIQIAVGGIVTAGIGLATLVVFL